MDIIIKYLNPSWFTYFKINCVRNTFICWQTELNASFILSAIFNNSVGVLSQKPLPESRRESILLTSLGNTYGLALYELPLPSFVNCKLKTKPYASIRIGKDFTDNEDIIFRNNKYDVIFYTSHEDVELVDDGERSVDKVFREDIIGLFDMYLQFNIIEKGPRVVHLEGTVEERLKTIKSTLDKLNIAIKI